MEELVKLLGAAAGSAPVIYVINKLYPDLIQPSIKKIGERLAISIELSNLKTRLESEKAQILMKKRLDDYAQKINDIPEEQLCEVNPQIGVPILERLSYTMNDQIADLFTSLLAKASSLETINQAHPAFFHVIDQLSPDEANVLFRLKDEMIETTTYQDYDHEKNWLYARTIREGDLPLSDLVFPQNFLMYYSHLQSLNLVQWVTTNKEFPRNEIGVQIGLICHWDISLTEFGNLFVNACAHKHDL